MRGLYNYENMCIIFLNISRNFEKKKMNWFQRHLNWTTLGIAVMSLSPYILVTNLNSSLYNFIGRDFITFGFPVVLPIAFSFITWLVLSAIGYGWILYQKKRSPLLLLFFIPPLAMIIGALIYKQFYSTNVEFINPHVRYMALDTISLYPVAILLYIFLGVGWLVLLLLKNHSTLITDNNNDIDMTSGVPKKNLLGKLYDNKFTKYVVISVSALVIILMLASALFTKYGYITYRTPDAASVAVPNISFEYKATCPEPFCVVWADDFHGSGQEKYLSGFIIFVDSLFHGYYYDIRIEYSNDTEKDFSNPDTFIDNVREWHYSYGDRSKIPYTTISINGITAYQFTVTQKTDNEYPYTAGLWLVHSDIYFYHAGYFWTIELASWDNEINEMPAGFTHLLDTLKISD